MPEMQNKMRYEWLIYSKSQQSRGRRRDDKFMPEANVQVQERTRLVYPSLLRRQKQKQKE